MPDKFFRIKPILFIPRNEFSSFEVVVRGHIMKALELSGGSVYGSEGAARLLNLNPSTLRGKMRKLGIPHGHGK